MSKERVHHEPGQVPETISKILIILAKNASTLGLYKRGDILVEFIPPENCSHKSGIQRPTGAPIIKAVSVPGLCRLIGQVILITRFDARKGDIKVIDPPRALAEAILSMPDWSLPELLGYVEAPIIGLDGREYAEPGYHPEIGLYIAVKDKIKAPRGVAGRARGTAGIKKLLHLLRGFAFRSPSDQSAALAAIMTALLRRLLPSAPFFGVSAPTAGTGKSKLVDVFSIIATGRRAAVLAMGNDEPEFVKRLSGALLEGDVLIAIDNVTRPFGNEDILNQAPSQQFMKIRILGATGNVTVPTNTLLIATGNNLAIIGDLKRRTCLIQMDARVERPELREFDFDVLQEAIEARNDLIRAALDITGTYLDAGAPSVRLTDAEGSEYKPVPVGSFEEWDRMVRRALIYHGQADPLESAEVLRESDPDLEAMSMLFSAWHERYQDQPQTASQVIQDALDYAQTRHTWPELHEGVSLACSGKIEARRIGNWLRAHKNRICDGLQLIRAGKQGRMKSTTWSVRTV